jgi:hypothetical protein
MAAPKFNANQARFAPINKPNVLVNADMRPSDVQRFC